MKLHRTRRNWNRFARTDPLWAILTSPDKADGRWQIDEFFATGRQAIVGKLEWIRRHTPEIRQERALDFGCGVGRLSQALAEHFHHVDGVDIAEEMLSLARHYNRHGERVRYLHNAAPDLRQLPSNHYDLVLSEITLQHVAPRYARAYIAEFVRVCARRGVVSFQLPALVPPEYAPERFAFSWYPPTLWKRLHRWGQRWRDQHLRGTPVMEMHAIPRAEVEQLLVSGGMSVLAVEPHDAGPRIDSYRYLARKD